MDGKSDRDSFDRDGYLVIDDFFDAALMDEIDELVLDHFGEDPEYQHSEEFLEQSKAEVIPWFPQKEGRSSFDLIDGHEPLAELTAKILGDAWQSLYCMVMFSKQGTVGQAWHQDCAPASPDRYNLNRLVYSHDIDAGTGGQVVVVPGSHRRGLITPGDPLSELEGQRVLEPRKGTLVLLHGHTWHRVLPVSGRFRYSTNFRAIPRGVTEDITDVCVYRNMRYRFSTSSVVEDRG